MSRLIAIATIAVSLAVTHAATAAQNRSDPLRAAADMTKPIKLMSKIKRTRYADSSQCAGQSKPVVACSCEATDSAGVCTHEVCETVCTGDDKQED